jgi:hypothetical protein
MSSKEFNSASSFLSSLISGKTLKVAAIAAGGAALILGGVLYYQFETEQAQTEALRADIYPLEQVLAYLQDFQYHTYPCLLQLVTWVPTFRNKVMQQLRGQRITQKQF